jgi:competence protein ComEA
MSPRRPSPARQETAQRRLALLHAEIQAAREDGVAEDGTAPPAELDPDDVDWPAVPVPGRHASRRPGARARELLDASLPEPLRGRVRLGSAQLTVIALVVAAGLAITCWWLVRGQPDELRAPAIEPGAVALTSAAPVSDASPVAATAATNGAAAGPTAGPVPLEPGAAIGTPGAASATGGTGGGSVTVDVAGKVRRPGIVVLHAGARVVDAIDAAGGARRGVDLTPLNLARLLVDGEQVLVGVPAGAAAVPVPATTGSGAAGSGVAPGLGAPVNLNTASEPELEALPDVGPVTAQSILTWRDQHGRFTSVDELLEVDGIGDATLAKLTPYVTV